MDLHGLYHSNLISVILLALIAQRSHAFVWSALFDLPKVFRRNHFLSELSEKKTEFG